MNFRKLQIACNNWLVRHTRRRVAPAGLLVLLPRCLQRAGCGERLVDDLESCRRCGQCDVAALLRLRDEHPGVRFHMAGGGRAAAQLCRQPDVRAIVACACAKELGEGIRAAFPKPVLAVPNETPEGFCRNTRVPVDALRAAIRRMLLAPRSGSCHTPVTCRR
jgi:hypothetical protein